MSAPGADPLAAIGQKRWLDRDGDDVNTLLAIWDTRESALRALVAQLEKVTMQESEWLDKASRNGSDGSTDAAYNAGARARGVYVKKALERILSGPQP